MAKGGRSGCRRLPPVLAGPDVGDCAVPCAIGLPLHRWLAAEVEALHLRITQRKAAHSGPQGVQFDDMGKLGFVRWRRAPLGQPQTMNFADHRVLRNPQAATDFTGRQFLAPQGNESSRSFGSPFSRHQFVPNTSSFVNATRCHRVQAPDRFPVGIPTLNTAYTNTTYAQPMQALRYISMMALYEVAVGHPPGL
jgi:hypothetical protein